MKTLTGTPKQITWAEDLRTDIYRGAEQFVASLRRAYDDAVAAGKTPPPAAVATMAEAERLLGVMRDVEDASWWIDLRPMAPGETRAECGESWVRNTLKEFRRTL